MYLRSDKASSKLEDERRGGRDADEGVGAKTSLRNSKSIGLQSGGGRLSQLSKGRSRRGASLGEAGESRTNRTGKGTRCRRTILEKSGYLREKVSNVGDLHRVRQKRATKENEQGRVLC